MTPSLAPSASPAPAAAQAFAAVETFVAAMNRGDAAAAVAGDLALVHTRWSLEATAPDGAALRRQPDGRWLIAIDNPWGTAVLPG